MKIKFIGHAYHQTTKSSQFFIEILERFGDIEYVWDDVWVNPDSRVDFAGMERCDLIVLWQLPHVAKIVPDNLKHKCVYVPMHDAVSGLAGKFWRRLRGMRVLCLSMADYVVALNNKLETACLQYYPESKGGRVVFDDLRLFFWQRQVVPNWRTLSGKIPMTQFESIHLHKSMDPGAGKFVAPIESEVRRLNITQSEWFESKDEYFRALGKCNVFVAPRNEEGIGMALLEAMSGGMVAVANDAPSMNEYIVDGLNGYLMSDDPSKAVIVEQPEMMSEQALHYIRKGRENYLKQLPDVEDFLLKTSEGAYNKFIGPIRDRLADKFRYKQVERQVVDSAVLFCSRVRSDKPKVSVVTVVRNDRQGLARTLKSVFSQSFTDFEFVIVDGNSSDGTHKLIDACRGSVDRVIREDDLGPYDAMNKGIKVSSGEYVVFMNAGDQFFDARSLEFALEQAPADADVIYGHHIYYTKKGKAQFHRANSLPQTYARLLIGDVDRGWLSGIPCHQSTMVRRTLLEKRPFAWESLPIAADHALLFDAMKDGVKSYHTNTTISIYYGGGLSSQRGKQCAQDWKAIALKHTNNPREVTSFYDRF